MTQKEGIKIKDRMRIKISALLTICLSVTFLYCTSPERETVNVEISDDVISTGYIGNGVEWDPYDEAEIWGASVSEEDWQKLFTRVDFMRPGYIRLMINSPFRYYNPETGEYDKTRNIESLKRLLQYCQDNDIIVMYGEYNPPTWEMKEDQRWIDMSVDYLNYLVNELGFSCIEYFVIFNEPDGDWASTNGDYELWKSVLFRFADKMSDYPGLSEKVKFAAPDVVMDYENPNSKFDDVGWVKKTAEELDSLVGVYNVHAYPGQHQVRSGEFSELLAKHKAHVPKEKKIILGEAGYKYWREADSVLMNEYVRRAEAHPYTEGSDANMLVYDYFYGLDMGLLSMEVMNAGYSGIAAWMLDDAMHSNGDSGNTEDIKLWGMWNILGEEVFNNPSEEEIRPWYYTWSLMCRYFPSGCTILKIESSEEDNLFMAAAEMDGRYVYAVVNVGAENQRVSVRFPSKVTNASLYVYEEDARPVNDHGHPIPVQTGIEITESFEKTIKSQSFLLLTNIE